MLVVALLDDAYRISAMVVLLWVDLYGIYEKCKGCGLNFKTLMCFLRTGSHLVSLTLKIVHRSLNRVFSEEAYSPALGERQVKVFHQLFYRKVPYRAS